MEKKLHIMQSPDGGAVKNLPPQERMAFSGTVRPLLEGDLPQIREILRSWIINPETGEVEGEEIERDLVEMGESIGGNIPYSFLVAEENGRVIGVVGMKPPEEQLQPFITTSNPYELIRMYVSPGERSGRGVGTKLLERLRIDARSRGATELILQSGRRHEGTAWEWYDRQFDGRIGMIRDRYGEGFHAPVWREIL